MILKGQRKIMDYTGRSWRTLMSLKRRQRFPMQKINGRWESMTDVIDDWQRRKFMVQPKE